MFALETLPRLYRLIINGGREIFLLRGGETAARHPLLNLKRRISPEFIRLREMARPAESNVQKNWQAVMSEVRRSSGRGSISNIHVTKTIQTARSQS